MILGFVVKWLAWISEVAVVLAAAWEAVKKLWDEMKPGGDELERSGRVGSDVGGSPVDGAEPGAGGGPAD
jgi:hypothetical protein